MNFKKIIFLGLFIFFLVPIVEAKGFMYIDHIKDGNYAFFLIDLGENDNIELNVTHDGSGDFALFIFNKRPIESYVKSDKTLNPEVFNNYTVNYSLDDNPYLNYNSTVAKIYYIEIILLSGGPDTFILTSRITNSSGIPRDNQDLTRYYLPIIPGFQLDVLIPVLIFSLGVIFIFYKKKKIK